MEKIERASFVPWLLAARPKTLTASIVPVLLATTLAWKAAGTVNLFLAFCGLCSALCIQIGTNLVNDALDFKKGTDTDDRFGPARVTQQGILSITQVLAAGAVFLALALFIGMPLMLEGGWPLAAALGISVLCAYCYTGGPFPIAYVGLSDLFVIGFFGLVCTTAMYYVQVGTVTPQAVLVGLQVGMLATAMSIINNLRDVVEDARNNKRTLAVRFGSTFSRIELAVMIFTPYALNVFAFYNDSILIAAAPFLALALGAKVVHAVAVTEPSKDYNRFLALAALHQLAFGFLLAGGLLIG